MSVVPDFSEAFYGWKGMRADAEGILWSPQQSARWPVNKPLVAKCVMHRHHAPPVRGCGCGIHVHRHLKNLKKDGYHYGEKTHDGRVWVIAEVALFGRVERGSIGHRGGTAEIVAVFVPPSEIRLGKLIRERYRRKGIEDIALGIINRFTGEIEGGRRHSGHRGN